LVEIGGEPIAVFSIACLYISNPPMFVQMMMRLSSKGYGWDGTEPHSPHFDMRTEKVLTLRR
jgi:hypothetical protein